MFQKRKGIHHSFFIFFYFHYVSLFNVSLFISLLKFSYLIFSVYSFIANVIV